MAFRCVMRIARYGRRLRAVKPPCPVDGTCGGMALAPFAGARAGVAQW